jgi:aldose 1-epimerase
LSVSISRGSSSAVVETAGGHVAEVTLGGEPVVKPSTDGSQTHGGIAVLLPYAGRVRRGEYTFEGRNYKLPVGAGGNAIHGFAKDARWKVARRRADSVLLTSRLEGQGFPGIIEAAITYSIARSSFSTSCAVKNIGKTDSPMVVGFHPYFLGDDWRISTERTVQRYLLRDSYFPTGERVRFSFEGVGPRSKLDDCFKASGVVRFHSGRRELVIRRRRMPYLVVYDGEYAEGRSVAIEPYTGLPDAYNNGIGLVALKPGRTFRCGYDVRLARL